MANDQKIEVNLTANSTGVETALAKLAAGLDKTIDKLTQVERKAKDGEKSLGKMTDAAVRSYGASMQGGGAGPSAPNTLGPAIAGLTASIGLLIKTQQEAAARQENARAAAMSVGETMRQVRINFTEDATISNKELEEKILGVAARTGAQPGAVGMAASNAFSAGADTNQAALNAVEAALRVNPLDATAADTLAGRAIDISQITGQQDMRANIGFMLNVQQASRVKKIEKLGATAVPAMAAIMARGDDAEQAMELFAGMNQLKKDETGEQTGTAVKNLSGRLATFVTTQRGDDDKGKFTIPKDQIEKFAAAASTTERIAVMQKSPELRRQFIDKNPFEAGDQAFIEQILSADPRAVKAMENARRLVNPLDAKQVALFEKKIENIQGGQFEGTVGGAQASASNIDQFRLNNTMRQRTATARNTLNQTLDEVGTPWLVRQVAMQAFETGVNERGVAPEQAAGSIMRSIREKGVEKFGDAPNQEQQQVLNLLQQQIELQKKLLAQNEGGNRNVVDAIREKPQVPKQVPAAALGRK